jgi:hypothetical protein
MQRRDKPRRGTPARRSLALLVMLSLLLARDAPARTAFVSRVGLEIPLTASARASRIASWAAMLDPIEVACANTKMSARIRLYDPIGEIDEDARALFEHVVSGDEPRRLAPRVEQLVFKAAYHFGAGRVHIVSAWRERAGKHTMGNAVDFKLDGTSAWQVAAYLRGLPRLGVGVYTHPDTQFVHVDVRDESYHWIDSSPPGVHWKERQIGDRWASERDAAYQPEMDLPL